MFIAQHVRIFSSLKNAALISTQRALQIHGDLNFARQILPAVSAMHPEFISTMQSRNVHVTSVNSISTIEDMRPNMGFLERILRRTGITDIQKYRNMALGYHSYEHIVKQIDYSFFFKYFNMADTFFSWFLVTELHVWMLMVRYMAEGNNGKFIRNNVVSAMWEDTSARVEKLGAISSKLKKKQIQELSEQFNAAIIGYDEGMQSDDKVLAGALWRRFFHLECKNPEHVETLLIYVRKQICLLDTLPSHEILRRPIIKLIDIKSLCKHRQ